MGTSIAHSSRTRTLAAEHVSLIDITPDGFVNFVSTRALLEFARARLGTRWNLCGSDKLCVASYANIQGKANLVAHFRNSSVLDQEETRRPKLFVTNGPFAGQPEPFPREFLSVEQLSMISSHSGHRPDS